MGFGSSLKRIGAAISTGGLSELGRSNVGGNTAIGAALAGPAGALTGFTLDQFNKERESSGLTPATQEQLTAANVFSKLSPTEQKDILINNPNIVTALGEQKFDPLTNTLTLTESPFVESQRKRQQQLAEQLSGRLIGEELPGVDPSSRFEEGRELLQPAFTEQRERLEQQLADQGIPRGSEAFEKELNRLERSQGTQLTALARESVATSETQRQARFNEISSLLGTQQVGGIGFQQFQPGFQGADIIGSQFAQQQLASQETQARKNRSAAQRQALIGAFGTMGSSGIKAIFSDIRLKENVEKVGESESGLPIYHFDYINKAFGQFRYEGVMAQDLKESKPEALIEYDNGTLAVNYDKIDVNFRRVN